MVHDAIAKRSSKHLTFLGVGNNKAGRGSGRIGAVPQFSTQFFKVNLKVSFKPLLIGFITFVATGIEIGL